MSCLEWIIFIALIGLVIAYWPAVLIVVIVYIVYIIMRNKKWSKNKYYNINFDIMEGHEFEYFCADVLKDNGFSSVRVTQGSGDHGIDILANKDGKKYAIQCKRYSRNVGNKAVQEAYSGKDIYKSDIAIVMTNQFFTEQAISDAKKLGVILWDRNKLTYFIRCAMKNTGENK